MFINAESKNNNELNEYGLDNPKFKTPEKPAILKLSENNKTETEDNQKTFEKAFKYYLKKEKNIDPKYYCQMQKLEENLILQSSDILIKTLSVLAEKLIKYIEREKNLMNRMSANEKSKQYNNINYNSRTLNLNPMSRKEMT